MKAEEGIFFVHILWVAWLYCDEAKKVSAMARYKYDTSQALFELSVCSDEKHNFIPTISLLNKDRYLSTILLHIVNEKYSETDSF